MTKRYESFSVKILETIEKATSVEEYFQKMNDLIEEHDREILESVREELLKE